MNRHRRLTMFECVKFRLQEIERDHLKRWRSGFEDAAERVNASTVAPIQVEN